MDNPPTAAGRAWGLEPILCGLVLASLVYTAWFFRAHGYLPQPYVYDTNDTFMDWFNTAYWAHNPGPYEVWRTVYPPLSFVFLRLVSLKACYLSSPFWARDCDGLGRAAILGLFLLNAWLVWRCFRRNDASSAIPRTLAMALGLPMLFALERGNLIVPCFTAFILGHGPLVSKTWLRWLAIGATINFKPYLLVTALAPLLRRRWRRFEGIGVATLGVYLASLALQGAGDPLTLIRNGRNWVEITGQQTWGQFYYATSYSALLSFLSDGPSILEFVGSRTLHRAAILMTAGVRIGQLGVLGLLALSWRGSISVPAHRLGALCLCLALTSGSPGGYAEVFLLFLVFLDRQGDAGTRIALATAYLLCISADWIVVPFAQGPTDSWLGGREVYSTFGVAVGQIVRPGLLLVLEYALVVSTLVAQPRGRSDHREVRPLPPGRETWRAGTISGHGGEQGLRLIRAGRWALVRFGLRPQGRENQPDQAVLDRQNESRPHPLADRNAKARRDYDMAPVAVARPLRQGPNHQIEGQAKQVGRGQTGRRGGASPA